MRGVLILEIRAGLFHLRLAVLGGWSNSTSKMAESESEPAAEKVEPVIFMNSDVDQEEGNYLTVWEICTAVSEVVSCGTKAVGPRE